LIQNNPLLPLRAFFTTQLRTRLTPRPQEKHDRSLSWYHKRNFTLYLQNNPTLGGQPALFAGSQFTSGAIFAKKNKDAVDRDPATTIVSNAAWIICAVSLRGQERYRWRRNNDGSLAHNGWCWDGQTMLTVWRAIGTRQTLQYYSCDIDFVGAPHVKRGETPEPIGYWGDEAIYSVKRSKNYKTRTVEVEKEELKLPSMSDAFPLRE